MEKRKHSFSEIEKKLFLDILEEFKSIVECKKIDGQSLQVKNKAWKKISDIYNTSPNVSRKATSKQLRRLWVNMKQRLRRKLSIERPNLLSSECSTSDVLDSDASQLSECLLVCLDETEESDTASETINNVNNVSQLNTSPLHTNPVTTTSEIPIISPKPIQSIPNMSSKYKCMKSYILEKEYNDREKRANELHALQIEIAKEKRREAKAKADLAELILEEVKSSKSDLVKNQIISESLF